MAIEIVPTKEGMKDIDRSTFKDVDAMTHACQDQMEWCDENDIEISRGGNADKN